MSGADAGAFASLEALADLRDGFPSPSADALAQAAERNASLTKPAGALGRFEELAIWYAGWRGDPRPHVARAQAIVFAGNHGVAARGVSPYPAEVTAQMVANFEAGGAAINQLVDLLGVHLSVIPIELETPTDDFTEAPAMSEAAFLRAVSLGWTSMTPESDCLILGEMGIGNTTAAAAVAAALFGGDASDWTGRGAGVDDAGLERKRAVVAAGLERHRAAIDARPEPLRGLEALRRLGGREMAAIFGAALRARTLGAPLIVDGFITTASIAALGRFAPDGLDHCVAGHVSAESGHRRLLDALGLRPLLDLGLRLGEGSGAAVAFGVLQSALACHSGMATFAQAQVSGRSEDG